MTETPPQSGSGRKEQTKSKAAIRNCTHSFAQRVQSAYCQASDGGVEGARPLARFLTAFSRKKAVSPKADAFRPRRRAAAAARSRSNRKPQNKKLHTLLCAARAVPFSQGLTMRGQGACPLRSLGVSKGPFSTVENAPFGRTAVRRQISHRRQAADLTRSPVSGCRRPRRPSSASSGSVRRRCSWP